MKIKTFFRTLAAHPVMVILACATAALVILAFAADTEIHAAEYSQPEYSRSAFRHWIDTDRDCQNTRHETLIAWSRGPVSFTNGRECSVSTGSWDDPYTGQTYSSARRLDVDHVVPLAWAWSAGAWRWPPERRREFANDPANLLPVYLGANRSKGAKGPTEWMPPNAAFHCEYLLRFIRVLEIYSLPVEQALRSLEVAACYAWEG